MISRIGDLLLLPWSVLVKLSLWAGSTIKGAAAALLPVLAVVALALLANKLLGARAPAAPGSATA